MKRLRVKTGIVVPSRVQTAWERIERLARKHLKFKVSPAQPPLVPLIRCTTKPPCEHCYYCQKAAGR